MRIGIDGIVLRGRDAGSLRYFEQLLVGLNEMDLANRHVVFVNRAVLSPALIAQCQNLSFQNVRTSNFIPGAIRQQSYMGWHGYGRLDLLHCPTFVPPFAPRCKTVTTVFDLTFALYPQTMRFTGRFWWGLLGKNRIQKSDRIISLSDNTKRDLVKHFSIPEKKIKTIYPATRSMFGPKADRRTVKAKYKLPDKYILYVGTLERRKNIGNLVRAFALAKQRAGFEHLLVLCGKRGWLYDDIFRTVEELHLDKEVIFLGYVPDEDLPGLYADADLFVYLSRFEGFGLPVLEGMACGTPVLTSNSSSLPEVVGDAGIMVSPDDVERAAAEMARILSDSELRATMVERGLGRAKFFSPEQFIRQTLEVYNDAMH